MRLGLSLATLLATLALVTPALAGVYSDTLGKCLVSSSSDDDKIVLARWIFGAMSAHPKLADLTSINGAKRDELNKQFAQLTQRLLVKDCRKETIEALKYEGQSVIEQSFNVLGQAATQEIMNNPAAQKEVGAFAAYFDLQALNDLEKEAGVPTTGK